MLLLVAPATLLYRLRNHLHETRDESLAHASGISARRFPTACRELKSVVLASSLRKRVQFPHGHAAVIRDEIRSEAGNAFFPSSACLSHEKPLARKRWEGAESRMICQSEDGAVGLLQE